MRKRLSSGCFWREAAVHTDKGQGYLAAYYSAVARGLAVQARDGASREKLAQIGRLAMSAWPAGKSGRSNSHGA